MGGRRDGREAAADCEPLIRGIAFSAANCCDSLGSASPTNDGDDTCAARGFTLAEMLTALVVVVIVTAVAVPMWRNHQLRIRRADAIGALLALQAEQDRFFGQNARYAAAAALNRKPPEDWDSPHLRAWLL